MDVKIYAIIDPHNKEVRYIGKTIQPEKRFKRHILQSKYMKTHTQKWINKLLELGLEPIFEIIDCCDLEEWHEYERFYVSYFRF